MANITVTPSYTNGGTTCTGPDKTFTITVNPAGQVNKPSNQTICNGSLTSTVSFTSNNTGGTTTYSWSNNTPSIGLAAIGNGDINAFTAINAGTSPVVATITVTPHFSNSSVTCDGPSQTFTITVNPSAQVNQPSNQIICNNSPTGDIIFTTNTTGGTATYTWVNNTPSIGLAASGTGNILQFTATNTGVSPVTASIVVTPHYLNNSVSCSGPDKTFTITVNPSGQVNQPLNQIVCNGGQTTAVSFSSGNTGGTTSYTRTNDTTGIGLAINGTGNIIAFTAINTGVFPVVATIVVTPTFTNSSLGCQGPTKSFTITVNPSGQVNQPANQVVCNGIQATAISFTSSNSGGTTSYSWTNDSPGIGLAATGTGNITPFVASNTGSAPVVATIVVTPSFSNGSVVCTGSTKTFTITVNPSAQVNQPANVVVCNGSQSSTIVFATSNTGGTTSYTWTNDNTAIGLGAGGTGNITPFTAVNTGSTPVTANITVTPSYLNGGTNCAGSAKTFTITVNPTAQVNKPANQVVCNGAATSTVNFSTNNTGGTPTYSWVNDTPSIGLAASGNGNITAFTTTNSGNSPVIATITVTPHFTNGSVTCDGPTTNFSITVNPSGQVNQPLDVTACNNGLTSDVIFLTNNSGGTTTYNWTNNTTGIGLGASGTGNIPAFTAINTGSSPVTATLVVTPFFTNGSVTCQGPAKTFFVTVNPSGQVNQPASQVICNGAQTSLVTFGTVNTGGTTSYSWTNDTPGIGLAASGSGNISAFAAVNTGSTPVTATIVVIPSFSNGNVACPGPSKSFTITVNPTGQVNQPVSQVVCNGTQASSVSFTTGNTGGTTTYSWVNDTPGIGLAATGTGNISAFTTVNAGLTPVVATIIVTPTFSNGSVSCQGSTKTFTITVNPSAQVNQPANVVICDGNQTSAIAFSTNSTGGTTTYAWANDTPGIGLAASGSGNIGAFTATNTGTSPVVATITVTPSFLNGGTTCPGSSKSFTITVNPTAQVNKPANQLICNGALTSAVIYTTNNTGGTTTYSWTNNTPSIGLPATGTGDIAVFTAVNSGGSPVIATITITPHFLNGSVSCDGPVNTFTFTVNPSAQVNPVPGQTVCNNSQTSDVIFSTSNTGGNTTYSWTNDTPSIGLASTGTGNILKFNATNSGNSPVTATISVTPHFENGGVTCDGPAGTFTIIVNPSGQVNQPLNQVVCNSGQTSTVTFGTINSGGTSSYSWTNDTPGIGLAASGTGNIPLFTATNSGSAPVVATITVTPTFTSGSVACQGPSKSFTITVNPSGQVNQPAGQVICNNTLTSAVSFASTNTGGTSSYTWTNDTPGIGLAASGTGNIGAFTAVNAGSAPVIATVVVTPFFTNGGVTCQGPVKSFTFTVNPSAQVNQPANVVVCNNAQTTALSFTTNSTGGTTTYAWTNDNTSIGLGTSGTGTINPFTALNPGTTPVIATITVLPSFTNGGTTCPGTGKSFTITVNPTAQVNKPADQVICNNASTLPVVFSTGNSGGTTTYTWTNNTPSIGLAATGTGDISAFTAGNSGSSPVTATITITPHFLNGSVTCDGPTNTFTYIVNPSAQVNAISGQTVCNNSQTSDVIFSTGNSGGTTTYSWTNDTPSIGLASTGTGNILKFNAVNSGNSPVTATIVVTPHFTNGAVTCDGATQSFTIVVNPSGQVNQPLSQVVCNTGQTTLVTFGTTTSGGTSTYNWTNDTPGIGLAASGTGNIGAFTASNSGLAPVLATIVVTPTFTNGSVSCQGPSKTFSITVNPSGQVNQPSGQVICNNALTSAVTFTSNNSGGTSSYTWTNDTPGIGLAASGSGDISAFTAINTGSAPVVATIVVTPFFLNGSVNCQGPVKSFTITVNPSAQVNQPANVIVCNTSQTSALSFTTNSTGGSTAYAWTNDNPSIGLAASGTGTINPFTAVNTGNTAVTATITVTPSFTNGGTTCPGSSKSFTITVNPTPNVTFAPASTSTICPGSQASIILGSGVSGTTFAWNVGTLPSGVTMLNLSGSGNILETIQNTSNVMATVTFNIMPTASGCSPAVPATFPVVVNPKPTVIFSGSQNSQQVCSGTQFTSVDLSSSVQTSGVSYAWTAIAYDPVNPTTAITGFTTPNSGNSIPGENISSSLLTQGVIRYIVTPTFTFSGVGCPGDPQEYDVLVNPSPTVTLTPSDPTGQTICSGGSSQMITFVPNASPSVYTWQAVETVGVSGAIASGSTDFIPAQNLTATGAVQGYVKYKVVPIYQGGGSFTCPGGVSYSTIKVNPLPAPAISGRILVCELQQAEKYSTPAITGNSYSWNVTGAHTPIHPEH